MLRPVAGLLLILWGCHCAVADTNNDHHDHLKDTGNQQSIVKAGVVADGNFTEASLGTDIDKTSINGSTDIVLPHGENPSEHKPLNIPEQVSNQNTGVSNGTNDSGGNNSQNGVADQNGGKETDKKQHPSGSGYRSHLTCWLLSCVIAICLFL